MEEFPNKLSSSGWHIAREKVHPTTGFSGTVEDLSFLVHLVAGVEVHVNLCQECIERELTLRMELFLSLLAAL